MEKFYWNVSLHNLDEMVLYCVVFDFYDFSKMAVNDLYMGQNGYLTSLEMTGDRANNRRKMTKVFQVCHSVQISNRYFR